MATANQIASEMVGEYCAQLQARNGLNAGGILQETSSQSVIRVATWMTDTSSKPGLILVGGVGLGKTTMLNAMREVLRNHQQSCRMFYASDFETLFLDNAELVEDRVLRGNWCKYLLLDDIGTEPRYIKVYGNVIEPFNKIVEARYFYGLPLVFTTNLSLQELGDTYGERIADRLQEMCDVITFNGESFRKTN